MSLGDMSFLSAGQGGQQHPARMKFAYTSSPVNPTRKLFHEAVFGERPLLNPFLVMEVF